MLPKNSSVTRFGSPEMSVKDRLKLRAAYGCDEEGHFGQCGGRLEGDGGVVEYNGGEFKFCEWLVVVEHGFAIQFEFQNVYVS